MDVRGRIAVTGVVLHAEPGELGGAIPSDRGKRSFHLSTGDQQSTRLMLSDAGQGWEWQIHAKGYRQRINDQFMPSVGETDFRLDSVSRSFYQEGSADHATRMEALLDQGWLRYNLGNTAFSLGRQPVDYGAGRLWQPFNVYGAFSPTDLDTEYKPGIDAFRASWFPSDFSSLEWVVTRQNQADQNTVSSSLHYRTLIDGEWDARALLGYVSKVGMAGLGVEGQWQGMGWRTEINLMRDREGVYWFAVAGMDYRFTSNPESHFAWLLDTTLIVEWYHHSRGYSSESQFMAASSSVPRSLQPQAGRNVLGVVLEKNITPLVDLSLLSLVGPVKKMRGGGTASTLQQFNLTLSTGNESELVFSAAMGTGPTLTETAQIRSEFGALPNGFTAQWQGYY